jgi:hypothetical protein
MAMILIALERWDRRSWWAVPLGGFVAELHTMSFFLLGLTLLGAAAWSALSALRGRERRPAILIGALWRAPRLRYDITAGMGVLALGLTYYAWETGPLELFFSSDIAESVDRFSFFSDVSGGTFFDLQATLELMPLTLLLGVVGAAI